MESDNKDDKLLMFEKEGVVVQYALKNCPCKIKTISDKCGFTIEQMTQICNGYHPHLKDYVLVLSYCLKMITPTKGKHRLILLALNNNGIGIVKEDLCRLISGDSSNPLEYEKVLHVICTMPPYIKIQSYHKGKKRKGGSKVSSYYKQPYVRTNDQTIRTNDFEYGLTDT